jgi:hypothetical protein
VTATRACAALAVLASVALPLLVLADPPQPAAAGFLLPAGTPLAVVLDERLDSSSTPPGKTVATHLRDPIVVHGRTLAVAGTSVFMTVTETRRASNNVDGEIFVRLHPVKLSDNIELPLRLAHPVLSPPLVAANPEDVVLPAREIHLLAANAGQELVLPPGTILRAHTAATLDATDPRNIVVATPPPFTISTDRPYAAFTPIPLFTYNPAFTPPPRRRRGTQATPKPSPTPSPSASPSPTPSPTPT